ncbi:hypothetical protein [Paenibacillus hamazuiensis]|uniref:hypothetical protein n=1 Tax=Paenibacillus hamazuiensis TaxID=2936508 RepID=UPI0020109264|nr:hypothetical protein [Paenibacillus hamazuiensis]
MLITIKEGWNMAWKQPFAVIALFVYNLIWGLVLYKLVYSIIVPLLHRYPGADMGREAARLFWIESQFQLSKTDLLQPYLWWAFVLLVTRMLLTPLLNAGLFFSLHHTDLNSGYRFFRGIRQLAVPFLGLYGLRMLLTLAPLWWVLPSAAGVLKTRFTYESIAADLLPILAAYLAYGYLLHLVFMYLQFSITGGRPSWEGLLTMGRGILPALGASILLLLVGFLLTAVVMSASMIWAGFFALLGYQAYRLAQMFCKVWAISAQYRIWLAKA